MARSLGAITLSNGTGTRTVEVYECTSAGLQIAGSDRTPGERVYFAMRQGTTGLTPPPAPTSVGIALIDHGGTSRGTTTYPSNAVPYEGSAFAPDFFEFVANAYDATGDPRCGTLELDLRISTSNYNVSTRGDGTQTLPIGTTVSSRNRFWQRANVTATTLTGRGSTREQVPVLAFGDEVQTAMTLAAPCYASVGVSITLRRSSDGFTLLSTTTSAQSNAFVTLTSSLSNAVPATRTVVEAQAATTGTTHPASGSSSLLITGTTSTSPDVDPRLTVGQVKQDNTNVLPTPPSSVVSSPRRLQSELSFLWTRLTNARGEGVNGVSLTRRLYDEFQLLAPASTGVRFANESPWVQSTTNLNGEAGWTATPISWPEMQPGGVWRVRHSASGGASGLLSPTDPGLALIAADPSLICVTAGGPGTPEQDTRHFTPGETFVAGLAVFHVSQQVTQEVDGRVDEDGNPILHPTAGFQLPNAFIAIARFNLATGTIEVVQDDFATWRPAQAGDDVCWHQLYESAPGSRAYIVQIPGEVTATWSASDIFTMGKAEVRAIPVAGYLKEVTVTGINNHTEYEFDALSFLGLGGLY